MKTRVRIKKKGFTLVEIVTTLAIFGLSIGAIMSMFIHGLKSQALGNAKVMINRDIRSFTNDMIDAANLASYFIIYNAFDDRTEVGDGSTGDFLVFVSLDETNPSLIDKVVGFYRSAPALNQEGPVLTFETNDNLNSAQTVENLIPLASTMGNHQEVVEISRGLSNQRLFYNFNRIAIMIRGEIRREGTVEIDPVNTYNFTIAARG